jgi:hypothetical protein
VVCCQAGDGFHIAGIKHQHLQATGASCTHPWGRHAPSQPWCSLTIGTEWH